MSILEVNAALENLTNGHDEEGGAARLLISYAHPKLNSCKISGEISIPWWYQGATQGHTPEHGNIPTEEHSGWSEKQWKWGHNILKIGQYNVWKEDMGSELVIAFKKIGETTAEKVEYGLYYDKKTLGPRYVGFRNIKTWNILYILEIQIKEVQKTLIY